MARKLSTGYSDPIITIEIDKGLAIRNRLPLTTVTKFLIEFKSLITAIGTDLQSERGATAAPIDFGLEIVASGRRGDAFSKGSVRMQIAITKNIEVGVIAAQTILSTLKALNRTAAKPMGKELRFKPVEAKVISRLDRIAFIATSSKSEATFKLDQVVIQADRRSPKAATFGEKAMGRLREYRPKPVFVEHGVVAHGKLYELKDHSQEFDEESAAFWGELRLENGQCWRIQFKAEMEAKVTPLFRKQVRLVGDAHYFRQRSTKLIATHIDLDDARDYEAAFDELWGSEQEALGTGDFQDILNARYGE